METPLPNTQQISGAVAGGNRPSLQDIFGTQSVPSGGRAPLASILSGTPDATQEPNLGTKLLGRLDSIISEATLKPSRDMLNAVPKDQQNTPAGQNIAVASTARGAMAPEKVLASAGGAVGDVVSSALKTTGLDKPLGAVISGGYNLANTLGTHVLGAMGFDTSKIPTNDEVVAKYNALDPAVKQHLNTITEDALNLANLAGVDAVGANGLKLAKAGATTARDFTTGTLSKVAGKAGDLNPFGKVAEVASSPEVHPFIAQSPQNASAVTEAVKQGFEPRDIKFLATIASTDKPALQEMSKLAETGAGDLRAQYAGKRPADVVGDTVLDPLKKIQAKNAESGAQVDAEARALAGKKVDATPVYDTAIKELENSGVVIAQDGKWDFSKSIFNKTTALQNKLTQAFSDLPQGQWDAYDLHNFKKSIDQVVDYAKNKGELTGKTESILKSVRSSADNVLDSKFSAYDTANTDFKATREVLDNAHDLMGKKTDFMSGNANMRVGQAMRTLFNNTTRRSDMFTFLQKLQDTAGKYGIEMKGNPVDQALFAQVLEGVYGTPAITGLQGEVKKAVSTALKIARNPISGTAETVLENIDKMRGITPEAKKKALDLFIRPSEKVNPDLLPKVDAPKGASKATAGFVNPSEIVDAFIPKKSPALEDLHNKFLDKKVFTNPETTPLKSSRYAILTAENPMAKVVSPEVNLEKNNLLVEELRARGYDPIPVTGHYGGNPEHSFIVAGLPPEMAIELGKKYGQESVLTKQGLIYGDGTVNPADTSKINFSSKQEDFYSEMQFGKDKVKFSIPINFDERIPLDKTGIPPDTELHNIVNNVAPVAKEHIDTLAKDIASKTQASVAVAPLKSVDSLVRKLKTEKNGDLSAVHDIARNTVIPHTEEATQYVLEQLKNTEGYISHKYQDPADFHGYEGNLVKIKTPNGHIAEVQVTTPEMIYGKLPPAEAKKALGEKMFNDIQKKTGIEAGLGHKFYEGIRALDDYVAHEYNQMKELVRDSMEYYDSLRANK